MVVHFTDRSYGSSSSCRWDFGDDTTSTEEDRVHPYATKGTYYATLTTSNRWGSSTTTVLVLAGVPAYIPTLV